jgi:hypothetical protein
VTAIGRLDPTFLRTHHESLLLHQAHHTLAAPVNPLVLQRRMHAWTPINATPLPEDLGDLLAEPTIFLLAVTCATSTPTIVTACRNLKDRVHEFHRKFLMMVFHELVPHRGRCKKMAAAFFRMSRSWRKRSTSRRRRRTSSSSSV